MKPPRSDKDPLYEINPFPAEIKCALKKNSAVTMVDWERIETTFKWKRGHKEHKEKKPRDNGKKRGGGVSIKSNELRGDGGLRLKTKIDMAPRLSNP